MLYFISTEISSIFLNLHVRHPAHTLCSAPGPAWALLGPADAAVAPTATHALVAAATATHALVASQVLATKGGMDLLGPRTELLCAGLLFLTFALWRIVPIPVVLYAYRAALSGAGGCGLRAAERWLMALTVPIPLGLNLYFFRSLLKKAMRTYATTSPSKAKGG